MNFGGWRLMIGWLIVALIQLRVLVDYNGDDCWFVTACGLFCVCFCSFVCSVGLLECGWLADSWTWGYGYDKNDFMMWIVLVLDLDLWSNPCEGHLLRFCWGCMVCGLFISGLGALLFCFQSRLMSCIHHHHSISIQTIETGERINSENIKFKTQYASSLHGDMTRYAILCICKLVTWWHDAICYIVYNQVPRKSDSTPSKDWHIDGPCLLLQKWSTSSWSTLSKENKWMTLPTPNILQRRRLLALTMASR